MSIVIHSSVFLVNKKNEVLFVREGKEKVYGLLNLPGGKMEHTEEILNAAIRETREETGLFVKPSHLIGIYTSSKDEFDYVHFVFLSREFSGEIHISDSKILEAVWLPISQVKSSSETGILNAQKIHQICLDYESGSFPDSNIIKVQPPNGRIELVPDTLP